ncbi:MAG: hydantoinase/oxoprolinase family protein [Chloroflexi bacterium]|nr:hydantoinase/oxoprolinase family protein [Chloroflexota bacterium]
MNLALGIDTGGTYTDAVLVDHDTGQVLAGAKALTTRRDLAVGIRAAIAAVFDSHPSTPATPSRRSSTNDVAPAQLSMPGAAPRPMKTAEAAPTPPERRAWEPDPLFSGQDAPLSAGAAGATFRPADVTLVGLSTTLATNTLAEGQRGAAPLFLIGYDRSLMQQFGFEAGLPTADVVYIRGGHNGQGDAIAPLDEEALVAAILARRETAEAFAVSGYFAVRNPTHEQRARDLIEELTGRPVTCGHELTSKLNAVLRATTVALNAHLIAPLAELIGSVQQTLGDWGIAAPLMVVKGDGSLMRADWAARRPVETILSGPAASVVGAWHLAGRRDGWVVDVGGTTTDIGALREGWPVLNDEGATVAGWRTMVEAVDVHTAGLGGDSHVRLDAEGRLLIGPRRAVPLCLLASEHPGVLAELRQQVGDPPRRRDLGAAEFITLGRTANGRLAEADDELLADLARGPRPLLRINEPKRAGPLLRRRLEALETWGLVRRAAFTPTDALHVLGRFTRWDVEAARLAATVLAGQAGLAVETFCEQVVHDLAQRVATELVSKVCEDAGIRPDWEGQPVAGFLLRQALDGRADAELQCAFSLPRPVVAIGAPVAAYLPQVAAWLHTELVIPPHAEVANAVGAVAGGIIQRRQALISPLGSESRVRLYLPDGVHDFALVEAAVEHAQAVMLPWVEALATQAGAEQVVTQMTRYDQIAPVAGTVGGEVYLGTELTFIATGRPRVARGAS